MRRPLAVIAAATSACAAPLPLSLELPIEAGDRAVLVSIADVDGRRLYAIDPARAQPLPAAIADSGEPVDVVLLAYDEPLAQLGFAGAPGLVPWPVAGAPGRPLGPWVRAFTRTVPTDADGAWTPITTLPGALADRPAAREATCNPLAEVTLPIPPLANLRALVAEDTRHVLIALTDAPGLDRWFRVDVDAADAIAPIGELVAGLDTSAIAAASDGQLWLGGLRLDGTSTVAELWTREPDSLTFTAVPASPGMIGSPNGEVKWIAPQPGGVVWIMNKSGVIERRTRAGWDRRLAPPGTVPDQAHGGLVALADDAVDALLPFQYGSEAPRYVARVRGAHTTTIVASTPPQPSTLFWSAAIGLTLAGTSEGSVLLVGDTRLEDRHAVPEVADVQAMSGARFAAQEGVLYSGVNGFVREYYPSDGLVCSHPQLGFNVTAIVRVGEGWVAAGTRHAMGNPPMRLPAATYLVRRGR